MIVEKAKQHMATAVNKETQLPYVAMNPWIVSSAPASTPYWIGTPLQSTTSAVSVQIDVYKRQHVGAEDMPVATARRLMGDDKIVGATAKTVPWAKEAYEQGADYLGVGAIYPTTTKVKTVLTSTDTLRDICNAVPIPANAIGGLNKGNIDVLTGIPIAGICVVSAIMKADDPKMATEELKARAHELALI